MLKTRSRRTKALSPTGKGRCVECAQAKRKEERSTAGTQSLRRSNVVQEQLFKNLPAPTGLDYIMREDPAFLACTRPIGTGDLELAQVLQFFRYFPRGSAMFTREKSRTVNPPRAKFFMQSQIRKPASN